VETSLKTRRGLWTTLVGVVLGRRSLATGWIRWGIALWAASVVVGAALPVVLALRAVLALVAVVGGAAIATVVALAVASAPGGVGHIALALVALQSLELGLELLDVVDVGMVCINRWLHVDSEADGSLLDRQEEFAADEGTANHLLVGGWDPGGAWSSAAGH